MSPTSGPDTRHGSELARAAPTKPRRTLLLGYYGARNIGDLAMLRCLREWLEQQRVAITVLSENPDETRDDVDLPVLTNVPLFGQWSWWHAWGRGHAARLLRAVSRCAALCVGGGELLRDDLGFRSFIFAVEKPIIALLLRKPVYLLNVGIGQPTTWYGTRILGWLLRRCRRIVVRDAHSFSVCRAMGAANYTELRGDIVLDLPELLGVEPEHPAGVPPQFTYAAVAFRAHPNAYRSYPVDDQALAAFAASLDWLVEEYGLSICFLPFQDRADACDHTAHARIASFMQHRDRAILLPWTRDLAAVAATVRGARLVLAMRLHAAVLAAAYQRPCVVMPYGRKVIEFAHRTDCPAISPEALQQTDSLQALYRLALGSTIRPRPDFPRWLIRSAGLLEAIPLGGDPSPASARAVKPLAVS